MSKLKPTKGSAIRFKASGFLIRSLESGDASEIYQAWVADPELMNPLNMPARTLSISDLRTQIELFDRKSRHLLGIFDDSSGTHIGIVLMDVNREHRSARFSLFVGDRNYWGNSGLKAFADEFLEHLFEARGIEKIRAQVVATNHRMIGAVKMMGLRVEGLLRGEIRSFDGSRRIDQFVFGLLKQDWKSRRQA